MLEVVNTTQPSTLLDFGCGTAILLDYINKNQAFSHLDYTGLDLGEEFISHCKSKFPDNQFILADILEPQSKIPHFDFIVMNGVLTEKRDSSFEDMWSYTQSLLQAVFEKTRKGMAFNVMSKNVDWERDDLFHLSTDLLTGFLCKELSRNFIIRNDYGLYEYTVYLYK